MKVFLTLNMTKRKPILRSLRIRFTAVLTPAIQTVRKHACSDYITESFTLKLYSLAIMCLYLNHLLILVFRRLLQTTTTTTTTM